MSKQVSNIIVLGLPRSGRHSLVRAIVGEHATPSTSGPYDWNIDTKYYSAQTSISLHTPDDTSDFKGEALLLVFNATDEASFQAVKAWAGSHDTESAEVKLMVATHADCLLSHAALEGASQSPSSSSAQGPLSPQRPSWLNAAIDYAIEQCYEYIEVSCSDAAIDSRLELDGDPQGVRRVVDALQAHMWPGLVRKQRPDAGNGAAVARAAADAPASAAPNPAAPPGSTSQPSSTAQVSDQVLGRMSAAGTGTGGVSGSATPPTTCDPACNDSEDERDAEAFERMLEEMMAAKAQLGSLSDTERRNQAAAIAMRFAELMGAGSSDGEDSGA